MMKRYLFLALLACPGGALAADTPEQASEPEKAPPAVTQPSDKLGPAAQPKPAEREPRARLSDNPASNPIVRQGNLFTNRPGVAPEGTTDWDNPNDRGGFSRLAPDDSPPARQNLPGVTNNPRDERR